MFTSQAWRVRGLSVWLALLSGWMFVALLVGYLHTGDWQAWAVVNKFAGWFVLLGYFLVGSWVSGALDISIRDAFLRALFVSGWAICTYSTVVFVLVRFNLPIPIPTDFNGLDTSEQRLAGFFVNPNAFGYFVALLLALQAPFVYGRQLFLPRVHLLGATVSLIAVLFSGSRGAWIGLAVAWLVLFGMRTLDIRETLKVVVFAGAIFAFISYGPSIVATKPAQMYIPWEDIAKDRGVLARLDITREALDAWRQAPLVGIGLGSFLWEQRQAQRPYPYTIHSTSLWLLTETGVVGAGLFAGFFFVCLRGLLRTRRRRDRDPFVIGVFGALLVCLGASIGMEAMYQRHLWFLLGCALALPARSNRTGDHV